MSTSREMLDEAWGLLGGAPGLTAGVRWVGPDGLLPSRLRVAALAGASVGSAALAAAELAAARDGGPVPGVVVDSARVAMAYASDRVLRLDGAEQPSWGPLSGFWRTSDGWVRTHANYAHHRERLLRALGVGDDGQVGAAIASRTAEEVAAAVTAAGGLAVAVRSAAGWAAHPQGAAVARLPLLDLRRVGDAPAVPLGPTGAGALPAAGLRVLDLTRVIAGPVATRTLALLGADVLRIDSPELPEIPAQHLDTGMGKRSTLLDLRSAGDRAVLEDLLGSADVVVTGYRPGALERFGWDAEALLERRPSLIVASLSAWSRSGPWAERRAFDSVVQAACGIAEIDGAADGRPGALPAQALDHSTGYLMAAAVLRAVTRRAREGGGWRAEFSLAQTAAWLLRRPIDENAEVGPAVIDGPAGERDTELGRLRYALSPVQVDGGPQDWSRPPGRWGADAPAWR